MARPFVINCSDLGVCYDELAQCRGGLNGSTNPYARKINVTGATIADGVRSMFDDIIIVVDPGKLTQLELGAVSDYIAMLA
jgi:hypothetical protein